MLTEDNIITVSLKETALPRAFMEGLVKACSTKKRKRMALQMLYRNASLFLFYLRQVDKASTRVENELHKSMKNKELIQMLGLEKSLVYFSIPEGQRDRSGRSCCAWTLCGISPRIPIFWRM